MDAFPSVLYLLTLAVFLLTSVNGNPEHHDLAPPIMIDEPQSQIMLKPGNNHTLKCHAKGEPSPRFQWLKDSVKIDAENYKGKIAIEHSGSSDSKLTFYGFDASLEGLYECQAENPLGTTKSVGTKVTIPYLDDKFGPMDELVHVADLTSPDLNCSPPRGNPRPTISWQKDGRPLQLDGVHFSTNNNGEVLTIEKVNVSQHQGLYTCVASNIAGERISPQIKLVIEKPPMFIKLPPKQLTYNEGMNFTIPCEVTGANSVSWHTDVQQAILDTQQVFENQEDDSMVVLRAKVSYSGTYTCMAKNDVGQAEASSKIIIQPAVDTNILVAPESQTWYSGFTGTLDCRTKDQIITWTTPQTKTTKEELIAGQFSAYGKYYVTSEGTLFVYDVNANDQGTYTCKNGISAVEKSSMRTAKAVVEKQMGNPAPLIQLGSSDQRIVSGGHIVLLCEGSSTEKVTISWSKDGQPFRAAESSRYSLEESGTLIIKNAIMSDAGEYTCTAKSPSGTTNQSSSLEILAKGGIGQSYPVEMLPGPPATAPYTSFVNTSCVHLHWAPPVLNQHLIRYYRIEHYIYGLQSWTTVQSHIKQPESWICGLRPGRTYLFVARAMNDYGYGHASPISHEITLMDLFPELDESMIPMLSERVQDRLDKSDVRVLEPVPVTPTSLRVSWTVLRYPTLVKGFRLHFASSTHYPLSSTSDFVIIANPSERTHVLTDLQPWTTYNVSVQPFNGQILGRKSPWRVVFMPQVPPSGAPEGIETTFDSKKGIVNISWNSPPKKNWNGALIGYNMRVSTVGSDRQRILIDQNVTANAYTVSLNLTMFEKQDVNVQLAAFNKAGIGLYSDPKLIKKDAGSINGGRGTTGYNGDGSGFDWRLLIYFAGGLALILIVVAVLILIFKNPCCARQQGHGTRLRPVIGGDEKTYTGSMGSNGIATTEAMDLESLNPHSKLMPNYFNVQMNHMTPEMLNSLSNPHSAYKYHYPSNSPGSVVTSMSTPVHIEPSSGHHVGAYNTQMLNPHSNNHSALTSLARSIAPDVIRVPSPQSNPNNPEYAEISGGLYELAAASSLSSDSCAECQREREALAAAALKHHHQQQPAMTTTAQYMQQHNRQMQQQPQLHPLVTETCLMSHPSASSGAATPATSTIMSSTYDSGSGTNQSHQQQHAPTSSSSGGVYMPQDYYGGGAPHSSGKPAAVRSSNHLKRHGHVKNPHVQHFDHTNNNQMPGNGACAPVNNSQYHMLGGMAADYTKLDESISESDPETNTPPPGHPSGNNICNCNYPAGEMTSNRHSFINSHPTYAPSHASNLPSSASFLSGGTLPSSLGPQPHLSTQPIQKPNFSSEFASNSTSNKGSSHNSQDVPMSNSYVNENIRNATGNNNNQNPSSSGRLPDVACNSAASPASQPQSAHSRPRMGISSTVPSHLARSATCLPPYASSDVC